MKARLPKGYGGGGANNIQQLARQAQKLQDDMEAVSAELEAKEYEAAAGGGAVKVAVTGKMELTKVEISPEVVDPEDVLIWLSTTSLRWRIWWSSLKKCPASVIKPHSALHIMY